MNQSRVERIIQVLRILQRELPRKDPKELMELAYEIVMGSTAPTAKVTNDKL